jgi:hypothetical protein
MPNSPRGVVKMRPMRESIAIFPSQLRWANTIGLIGRLQAVPSIILSDFLDSSHKISPGIDLRRQNYFLNRSRLAVFGRWLAALAGLFGEFDNLRFGDDPPSAVPASEPPALTELVDSTERNSELCGGFMGGQKPVVL